MARVSLSNVAWALVYLVTMAAIVWALLTARRWALAELSRPEAQAQWDQWREEERQRAEAGEGPVARRPPKSIEPPALVLLRDSFAAIIASALVLATVMFAFVMLVVRGAWRSPSPAPRLGETNSPSPPD